MEVPENGVRAPGLAWGWTARYGEFVPFWGNLFTKDPSFPLQLPPSSSAPRKKSLLSPWERVSLNVQGEE